MVSVPTPLPSARWSWWRLAGDLCELAGEILTSLGSFCEEQLATHLRFVQNLQVDQDDARDFAGDVLDGLTQLSTRED